MECFAKPSKEKQIQATFWELSIKEVIRVDEFKARWTILCTGKKQNQSKIERKTSIELSSLTFEASTLVTTFNPL